MNAPSLSSFEDHLLRRGRAASTARKYRASLESFARDITVGEALYSENVAEELAGWITTGRSNGLSAATIRHRVAVARSFCGWLGANTTPLDDYKLPPLKAPDPHPLPGGIPDVYRMIEASTGPVRHAIALGGLGGLRVSESISIGRSDVDSYARDLVVKGKGEKIRRVPISNSLQGFLNEMPKVGRLAPLSNSHARQLISDAAEAAKVVGSTGEGVSSHDLRATFATAVYQDTNDIVLVQRLLGHANVATTLTYIGTDQKAARRAVEF